MSFNKTKHNPTFPDLDEDKYILKLLSLISKQMLSIKRKLLIIPLAGIVLFGKS